MAQEKRGHERGYKGDPRCLLIHLWVLSLESEDLGTCESLMAGLALSTKANIQELLTWCALLPVA